MLAVVPSAPLDAATLYWSATTDGLWTNAANWSTDPVAGGSSSAPTNSTTADVVVFNQSSVNRGETISFNADASIAGIVVSNTGSTTLASDSASARSLTIGASGLSVFGAGGTVTLGSASNPLSVAVAASQTWANNSTKSLTVLGNVTSSVASGTQTLTIAGGGSTTLSGILGNGGAGGTLALTKSGSGALSLTGAAVNTYTGNTTISFGSLLLDYGNLGTPNDLIASTSALVVNGGAMTLKGKSSGATSQSFNGTSITGGGGKVLVDPNGGSSTTVSLGSLPALNAWSAGTTLLVGKAAGAGSGTAAVTTTTGTDATGIYGGRMVYFSGTANTGYDWATSSGSGPYALGAYTGYSALAASGTDTANSRVTANTTPTGNVTTNSLKIENPAASQSLAIGSNTLTLSSGGLLVTGSNAFSITGGQITAGNGSGGYELIVHQYSSGTTTISGSITNNGANAVAFTKSGPGVLALTGTASTFTGDVRISEGTLVYSGANTAISKNTNSTLGAGTTIYLDGGTLLTAVSASGYTTISRDIVLTAGKTSTVSNASDQHVEFSGGTISGGGTLRLELSPINNKNLVFGGRNTFSGGVITNVNLVVSIDGTASSGNITNGPLGTGTVTFLGGSIGGNSSVNTRTLLNPYVLDGDLTVILATTGDSMAFVFGGAGTLTGNRTLSVNGQGATLSGTLGERGGQFGLTVAGTSTLSLTAANTFSGDVRVTGTSTLALGNVNALQNATLNLLNTDVGTVTFTATGTNTYNFGGLKGARNLSIGANSLSVGLNGQSTTYSGTISGTGGFAKVGSGTLTLSAANTYSGNVLVNAGALSLASGGGASGSNLGSNTVGKNVTVAAGATLVSAATDAVDFLSNVVNNIAFTISGTWNNNPANTSATGFQRVDTLTLNGAVINDYGNHGANYGAILMAGTTTIYGTSTYNQLGLGVGLGTGTATVFNVPDATGRFVVNGGLRDVPSATGVGLGTLTKTGSGTMVVGGSSSYTGSTKVSGGTLSVTSSNALSKSTTVTVAGGVLDLGSVSSTVAGFSVSSGTLAGTGKLTATTYALAGGSVNANLGAGTLTVTANSALNGTTDSATVNVNSGTLTLGSGGRFTSSSVVVSGSSGGTLVLGGNETIFALGPTGAYGGNNVDLGNGTLTLTGSTGDRKYDGVISGSGGVIMSVAAGINILRLNQQQTFTGGMTVNAGYLVLNATNTLATTGIVNLNGGSIDIGAIPQTWAGLSGSGGGIYAGSSGGKSLTLSVASGTSYTFSGVLGTGNNYTYPNFAIVKAGGGTQVLSGSNIYTGTTSVTGGILQFVRPASLYSGSTASWTAANVSTGSGATLAVSVGASNFTTGNVTTLLTNFGGLGGSVNNNGLQAGSSIGFDTSLAGGSFTVADSIKDSTGTGGGAIGLVKLGTGTLALTGTNTFSGATTITGGMLSIAGTNSLRGTSGVTIAGGAGLTYTGAADTFDRNITVTAGSGTGTVTNSGGGLLTLAGTLSKDNSVLRLTGGSFNVTGLITGTTVGASDLVVDAAGVTLSNTNTYNGPTFVYNSGTLTLGITNAIPATSVVTLGNGTSAGTLQLNGYTDAIGGLAFGSGGGTLRLSATSTSAAPLTAAAGTMTLTNGTLDLAGSGSTAGLYRVLSAQTIAGAFSSVTGASAAYQLLTTSTTIDYQQKAVLGAVAVTNPAVSIITGGSAAFTYTMANDALSGGATLSYTGTGLLNVAGSSSGSAAAGSTSGATSGLFFTGTTVGSGQGTFTVNAPTAYGSTTATGTVSVTVLDHATSSLAATLTTSTTISLGIWNYSSQTWESGTNSALFSIYNIASIYNAGFTANLSLLGVTGTANGFSTNLGGYAAIAGGTSGAYSIFFDPTGFNSPGSQSTTFVLSMSDDTGLSGAMATNTLYVTASVAIVSVPEPGGLVLAGIGAIGATWVAQRRRRRAS